MTTNLNPCPDCGLDRIVLAHDEREAIVHDVRLGDDSYPVRCPALVAAAAGTPDRRAPIGDDLARSSGTVERFSRERALIATTDPHGWQQLAGRGWRVAVVSSPVEAHAVLGQWAWNDLAARIG